MKKQYWKTAVTIVMLTLIMAVCLSMAVYRAASCMALSDEAALLSGKLSFVNGDASADSAVATADETPTQQPEVRPLAEQPTDAGSVPEKPQDTPHSGATYPVKEIKVSNGNMSYDNITIRNTTDDDLDVAIGKQFGHLKVGPSGLPLHLGMHGPEVIIGSDLRAKLVAGDSGLQEHHPFSHPSCNHSAGSSTSLRKGFTKAAIESGTSCIWAEATDSR